MYAVLLMLFRISTLQKSSSDSLPRCRKGLCQIIFLLDWAIYFKCCSTRAFFKSPNSHSYWNNKWNNKHPRVKFSLLTKPKDLGGLSLPNLLLYYWSAQLKTMSNWFMNRKDSLWLGLESLFCYPRRLNSLPFINNIDQVNHLKNNIIIYNTLLARRDVKKYLNIAPAISLCSPLALNPDLPAQIRSIGLMDWMSKGLSNFTDLLDSDSVK